MANNRILYASQAVAIKPRVPTEGSYAMIHGLQSVAIDTNFPLESVHEIGQLEAYELVEDIPEVEITVSKVLDGDPLIYLMATQNADTPTLISRSDTRCDMALNIYDDTNTAATGLPLSQCEMSGLYVSSLRYTFDINSNFLEEVTFQGNDRRWLSGEISSPLTVPASDFGTDTPTKSINRREDFLWGTDTGSASVSLLPTGIFGVVADGTNNNKDVHVSSINCSVDLGRESIFQLGDRFPYYRAASFPVQTTCDITITAVSGDLIEATEAGIISNANCGGSNLPNEEIRIAVCEGLRIYLGDKNKLSNVTYGGGDAGGGNVTVTYTYNGFSTFTVGSSGTGDPDSSLRVNSGNSGIWTYFGATGE